MAFLRFLFPAALPFRAAALFLSMAVAVLLFLSGSASTFADSERRPLSPAEKAFYERVLPVLSKAAPGSGPDSWTLEPESGLSIPGTLASGAETAPLQVRVQRRWKNEARVAEAEKQIAREIQKVKEKPSDQRLARLVAEQERLTADMATALRSQDGEAAARIAKKIEGLSAEMQKISEGRGEQVQTILRRLAPRDVLLSVTIEVNAVYEPLNGSVAEEKCSLPRCYRVEDGGYTQEGWMEGRTILLLGRWRLEQEDREATAIAVPDTSLPCTAVQSVFIEVRGERERAKSALAAMDLPALQALLGQ